MAAEIAAAPFTSAAGEVDLAGHALAEPGFVLRFGHFADELVAGGAGEAVVAALEFEVGGADAGGEQADARESLGHAGERLAADFYASGFEVNGSHSRSL
jgi:hypothetical protein